MEGVNTKYIVELVRDNAKYPNPIYRIGVEASSIDFAIYKAKMYVARNGSWNTNSSIDNRISRLKVFDVHEERKDDIDESYIAKQIIDFIEERMKEKSRILMKKKNFEICNKYNGGTPHYCTSYCDLLTKLAKDIESDECMPKEDKLAAMNAIHELNKLLWKYSY